MIVEAVARHYRSIVGEPTRRAAFQIGTLPAEVLKWGEAGNPFGVALYASLAACRQPLAGTDESHRVEFIIGLLPEQDGVARPLAMVALDGVIHGSALGHGQTVTYPEPLWAGTDMRTFLVLRQKTVLVPALTLADGTHVEFLQLVPLFPEEVEIKSARGADAMMAEFERARVPFWDPNRAPLTAGR